MPEADGDFGRVKAALGARYAIECELGRGGMATVYLAEDIRHARKVALKVLHPELGVAVGPERFLREIQVTARLHHPHILTLHDSGETAGLLYYVMPYVDGESLRARLARERQLPVDDAIRIACDVADALDYAHRHNVLHRDIKPENILLHDGRALVADFGIARAVVRASEPDTLTASGVTVGTPAYMSPEQAMGEQDLDARTDIHALGAVLYEMLAGEPPYRAPTAQGVVARLISEEARPLSQMRATVSSHVETAVRKALAKLPADRFATAREFAEAIAAPGRTAVEAGAVPVANRARFRLASRSRLVRRTVAIAPWAGLALLGAVALRANRRPGVPRLSRATFEVTLPSGASLYPGVGWVVALSRDGARLAYLGQAGPGDWQIFIREMDDREPRPIRGTSRAWRPSFSPDGKWLAFVRDGRLMKVPVAGGSAVMIADSVGEYGSYSWGDGNVIVFARSGLNVVRGLWRVSAQGGRPERLTVPNAERGDVFHFWPDVLPGGKAVVFAVIGSDTSLAAVRLDGRDSVVRLAVQGFNPRYVSSGHILFAREDRTISALPFDADRLEITGSPVPVLEDVMVKSGGTAELAVSASGSIAFVEGSRDRRLVLVDREGRESLVVGVARLYRTPRVSPDGKRIAAQIRAMGGADVWVHDIEARNWTRMTDDGQSGHPEWTPDGKSLVSTSGRVGNHVAMRQPWDKSGKREPLGSLGGLFGSAHPSPRGDFMVLWTIGPRSNGDLSVMSLDSAHRVTPLVATQADESQPSLSPDGKWLAYVSTETNQREVYVQPLSGSGATLISDGGATEPRWSRDGRELFYRSRGHIIAATIETTASVRVTRRDTLFADTYAHDDPEAAYDVTPDGSRFLFSKASAPAERVVVALGWVEALRERMSRARAGR